MGRLNAIKEALNKQNKEKENDLSKSIDFLSKTVHYLKANEKNHTIKYEETRRKVESVFASVEAIRKLVEGKELKH